MSKIELKPKLQYLKLIEHSKSKAIRFVEISEIDAINYMATKNYYFKLTSYRTNYQQINGKYKNLDFAYLIDLANIDATLRRFIITTSLNVEHALKVMLLNYISEDNNDDGYQIVQEFKQDRPKPYNQTIAFMKYSSYSNDLYNKHYLEPSVWVLIEFMSFGALGQFIEFYSKRNNTKKLKTISTVMKYAKNMRNAAAHSSPLLINLFTDKQRLVQPDSTIVTSAVKMGIERTFVYDMKVHDLIALLVLTNKLTSTETMKHVTAQAKHVRRRFDKHSGYYQDVDAIKQFICLFDKMIDFLEA